MRVTAEKGEQMGSEMFEIMEGLCWRGRRSRIE
jgi:hypothetical protein